jgi:hypothetical protein
VLRRPVELAALAQKSVSVDASSTLAPVKQIVELARELVSRKVVRGRIAAMGMAVPGLVRRDGTVWAPNLGNPDRRENLQCLCGICHGYKLQADHKLGLGDRLSYLEVLRTHHFDVERAERTVASYGLLIVKNPNYVLSLGHICPYKRI